MLTPTWALFNAPTSLVPSPHIKVVTPRLFRASTMLSLCFGENRANTLQRLATMATCNSDNDARASPRQHKPCDGAAAKGFTLLPHLHTGLSPLAVNTHVDSSPRMPTERATCAAVSTLSPVIITH